MSGRGGWRRELGVARNWMMRRMARLGSLDRGIAEGGEGLGRSPRVGGGMIVT